MSEDSLKPVIAQFAPGQPMDIKECPARENTISPERRLMIKQVSSTLAEYFKTLNSLLEGKYSQLRDYIPAHLKDPCKKLAICLDDGVILRFDLDPVKERNLFVAGASGTICNLAPLLSESVIYCSYDSANVTPPKAGVSINIMKTDAKTNERSVLATIPVCISITMPRNLESVRSPHSSQKPYCLISLTNEFDIETHGEIRPPDAATINKPTRFVSTTRIRLPVGWQCFEVYPGYDKNHWNPDVAPIWAENDILATIVRKNVEDSRIRAIDPHAESRKRFALVLKEFESILNQDGNEESLHQCLKKHPHLISPSVVKCWSKLSLGKRDTDFVIEDPGHDFLLVELERASARLFRDDGQQSEGFTHAYNQILDWIRYLEDNLTSVQRELGLKEISSHPRMLIVMGRSKDLTDDNRRKLTTIKSAVPKLNIMTYDDLLVNAKSVVENLIGPLCEVPDHTRMIFLPATT